MCADFTLEGNHFAAMDSARDHKFTFNEAISFIINVRLKKKLTTIGENFPQCLKRSNADG